MLGAWETARADLLRKMAMGDLLHSSKRSDHNKHELETSWYHEGAGVNSLGGVNYCLSMSYSSSSRYV